MKTLRLTFGKSENITRPDFAAIYRFPFTVIDTDLIGSAEETRHSLDALRLSRADRNFLTVLNKKP
jgi:hypothetical protein